MRYLAILLAVAGCHTDGDSRPDGGPGDGAVGDGTLVRVVDDGEPVPDVAVVFHRPDGSVDRVVIADSRGVAAHPLSPGGMVTVAHPAEISLATSRVQLLTVVAVDPGEELTVEIPRFATPYDWPDLGPIAGRLALDLAPIDGAGQFVVHLGCTDVTVAARDAIVDVPAACVGDDGKVDLTVEAYTPPDLPARLATTYAVGVELAADGPTPVTTRPWITTDPTIELTLTDLPDDATSAFAVAVMLANGRPYQPVLADSARLDDGESVVTMNPGFYLGFADAIDLEARLTGGVGHQNSYYLLAAAPEPATRLSADLFLPAVRDARTDPATRTIDWTAAGSLAGADALFLHLQSERPDGVIRRAYRWSVLADPTLTGPFALPDLPAELADYRPQPTDDYVDAGATALEVDWVADAIAFRRDHGFRFLDEPCVPVHTTARLSRAGVFAGPRLLSGGY